MDQSNRLMDKEFLAGGYVGGLKPVFVAKSAIGGFISGSRFIQAFVLRMCFGLIIAGLAVASNTALSEEGSFTPDLAILTIQPLHTDSNWLLPYQFSASVVLNRLPSAAPIKFGSGGASPFSVTKPQQEILRETNLHWQQTYDEDRVSLQRLLRIEFKGERANISFRPRLVSIERDMIKISFQPQSVLIEGRQLKMMLQPHSVFIMRSKAF